MNSQLTSLIMPDPSLLRHGVKWCAEYRRLNGGGLLEARRAWDILGGNTPEHAETVARVGVLETLLSDIWDHWAGGDVPEELGARIREALAQRAAQQGTGGNSQ